MVSEEFLQTLIPLISEEDGATNEDVLSPELRSNFKQLVDYISSQETISLEAQRQQETCKVRGEKRTDKSNDIERKNCEKSSCKSMALSNSSFANEKNNPDLFSSKRVQLAAHTLVKAESEIAFLKRGIAELESLLELNEESARNTVINDNIQNKAENSVFTEDAKMKSTVDDVNMARLPGDLKPLSTYILPKNPASVFDMDES